MDIRKLSFADLQAHVANTALKEKWGGGNPHHNNEEFIKHLYEECHEMMMGFYSQKPDQHLPDYHNVWVEMADMTLLMMAMAQRNGINLIDVLCDKIQVNNIRARANNECR